MLVDLYVSEACLFQRGGKFGGSVTGYGGGVARKVKLLELERTDMRGCLCRRTERRCDAQHPLGRRQPKYKKGLPACGRAVARNK